MARLGLRISMRGRLGRLEIEGLGGDLDARGDGPAQVLALGRDGVERRRRAEIEDDDRAAVFLEGGDRGRDPVGPDLEGVLVEDGHARLEARADDAGRRRRNSSGTSPR